MNFLGISHRVSFMGLVRDEEKDGLLKNCDVFCLPSSYDSFGMGFVEAMAYGLPVVALDSGPISDVVQNGRTGILVEKVEPHLIANAVIQCTDPVNGNNMGIEGKQWVLENYSPEIVGNKILIAVDYTVGQ